ncbi:AraC family transcriptional regulator [Pandoraea thiooxydans]|uniref:AraC family transcriptional regulator n=1 Tax=Pandoraea thiooxydans TaxID=445709 RepID=A0A0G3EKM1_9BURK|nr:helix-turn-helix domain-containing protein [Pandoraea thiooxydans]AKJ67490.1 AraC family transcriptional regulator [Pandoraea thiooxydans]APR94542.1 AraC family transcriptional regulator [Pandoraea thiooxydans]
MQRRQPVYFLVTPHVLMLDLAAPAEALRMAGQMQDEVAFELSYVSPAGATLDTSIGLTLGPFEPPPVTLPEDALLVLTGSVAHPLPVAARPLDAQHVAAAEARAVAWLRETVKPYHRLACVCTGALLAGRAGLLDDRLCTTHHTSCDELQTLAPKARVVANRLYVEDGNVYTSAGITAGLDLMLHLIGRLTNPLCAVAVARHMVAYLRRTGGDPQLSPWLEGRNHIHPAIHRVQDAVTADPARPWSAADMAELACTSVRHFTRLFREHTGTNPVDYVHRLRIGLARELLANSRLGIERVAEQAGFGSGRQLRRVWHKFDTAPPVQARQAARASKLK